MPSGQGVHRVEPNSAVKLPKSHRLQYLHGRKPKKRLLTLHVVMLRLARLWESDAYPSPAAEKVPGLQTSHAVELSLGAVPAEQGVQDKAPGTLDTSPTEQTLQKVPSHASPGLQSACAQGSVSAAGSKDLADGADGAVALVW